MTINLNKLIISKQLNAARFTQIFVKIKFVEITMENQTLTDFDDSQLAYQIGHEGYDRYLGKSFDEAETELKRDYGALLAQTSRPGLEWDKVKDAVRDAWDQSGTT